MYKTQFLGNTVADGVDIILRNNCCAIKVPK